MSRLAGKIVRILYRRQVPIILSVVITAVSILAMLPGRIPLLFETQQRIEGLAADARLRLTLAEQPVDSMVAIVAIDEKSLAEEGHWPWPRARMADLVRAISAAGAQSIIFDVTFPEPELNAVDRILTRVGDRLTPEVAAAITAERETLDGDAEFASALREAGVPTVLGFTFTFSRAEGTGALPESNVVLDGNLQQTDFLQMQAHVGNLPTLLEAAAGSGFFTVIPDFDGVVRRVPTVLEYRGSLYPSLEIEAMRLALGADSVHLLTRKAGATREIEKITIGAPDDPFGLEIPTDSRGRLIVPYRGLSPQFRYVSATDVLNGRIDAAGVLQNTVVLVGITAEGMKDLRPTPVQAAFPGVEVHATAISALFDATGFPAPPAGAVGADVAMIAISATLAMILFSRLMPAQMIVVSFVLVGAMIALNVWLWSEKQLVLSIATPVLTLVVLTFIHVNFRFLTEARSRRSLRDSFGQYVPPELVEEMYADPDKDFGFEGERREMSVLFSDIRGFTTLSESLDPHDLKMFLNEWFTPVTRLIFDNRGTIDKYVGDMIMAFWGAPRRNEDHARHAVDTALQMLDLLPRMQREFRERGLPAIDVGIGVNSGVMSVGDMGSTFRRAYTVLGDSVNLGSRLEGLTKQYGVRLIIGETTALSLAGNFLLRRLDRVRVKGKIEPITIFEPICRMERAAPELVREIEAHNEALDAYFSGDWNAATLTFAALADSHPESLLYPLYLQRIADMARGLGPSHWDGVYEHSTK